MFVTDCFIIFFIIQVLLFTKKERKAEKSAFRKGIDHSESPRIAESTWASQL